MYDVNTITLKGAELLAAATAADKLILDGCDATTTYIDATTAAAVSSRPASPLSNTTDVSLIGYTAEHVQARASFVAGNSTGGDANTLYLYGHKESAPSDIYVIYVASSQDSFHLPEVGDVANVYETLFDIIYAANADAVTTASTSTYCTLAEFNLLKERVVTAHKEGFLNEGDNQTIYGEKTFKDRVTFDVAAVTFHNYAYFTKDLRIVDPNSVNIGQENKPFDTIYVDDVVCGSISATDNIVTTQLVECVGINCASDAHFTEDVYIDGGLEVDGNIEPYEDRTAQLGTYDYPFAFCYAGGMMMHKLSADMSEIGMSVVEGTSPAQRIVFNKSNSPKAFIYEIVNNASINLLATGLSTECEFYVMFAGTKQIEIAYNAGHTQYETNLSTPLVVSGFISASGALSCGAITSSGLLTCTGIKGTAATYASSTTSVPIGGIFLGWVSSGYPGITGKAGEVIRSVIGQTFYILFAQTSGATISSTGRSPEEGEYVALNDFDTSNNSLVLLQRIS